MNQINGNSIKKHRDFKKLILSVSGSHCDYSPRATEKLATPLTG